VAVDVHRRLDGCVAELLFDVVQRLALLQEQPHRVSVGAMGLESACLMS